jgi:hypothetical protein
MTSDNPDDQERLRLASFVARECAKLGIHNSCPYQVSDEHGGEIVFAAYLPQFWGAKGVLVDVYMPRDKAIRAKQLKTAQRLGIPVSFVNLVPLYNTPDKFVECLVDWGYRGVPSDLRDDVRSLLLRPLNS